MSWKLISFPIEAYFKLPAGAKSSEADWIKYEFDRLFSFSILTHEVKSTLTKAEVLPITRLDDGKMIVHLMDKCGKFTSIMFFLAMLLRQGHHLFMKKIRTFAVSN